MCDGFPPLHIFLSVTGVREAGKTQGQHGELMQEDCVVILQTS